MNATSVTEHHAPTGGAQDTVRQHPTGQEAFSTDIGGLPGSVPTPTAQLPGGAVYELRVAPVAKQILLISVTCGLRDCRRACSSVEI